MIVFKAKTPEEARDAIVTFIQSEAERCFKTAKTKKPRAMDLEIARGNALKLAATILSNCGFVEKFND
jgi:hypothetical protein